MNDKLELEIEIGVLKNKISDTSSRLDVVKLNCLISKYNRLYGGEGRGLKNKNNLSMDEMGRLEREFHEFNRYKESEEYKQYAEAYQKEIDESNNSGAVFVRAHYRRSRSC